ncbi:hypothetical protein IWQ56_004002 [Coemansia nantahalensis]|uniref:Uncharacterized protein n=1 Tax=Coemansia nantahalensis TaxID=2789366 RepID=A0ACC1K4H2_9FUNG|nr:hypothetical protein IWQ56_004002 [Coemansia nantahalensis]KAJ2773407.1 hypothetical protein IWQ57_001311 [Coemansia nantahalensis]
MKFFAIAAAAVAAVCATVANAGVVFQPTAGQTLCCQVNQMRKAQGLKPLKWSATVDAASQPVANQLQSKGPSSWPLWLQVNSGLAEKNFRMIALWAVSTSRTPVSKALTRSKSSEVKTTILSRAYTVCGGASALPGNFTVTSFVYPATASATTGIYHLDCKGATPIGIRR